MAVRARVHVENLDELRAALRAVEDPDTIGEFKRAFRGAVDIVADEARMRANVFSFRVADTLRSGVNARRLSGFIRGGKASLSWYGWADFGSRRPRRGNPRSRGPWSGSGQGPREGRFIYPAIADKEAEVRDSLEDALVRAFYRN